MNSSATMNARTAEQKSSLKETKMSKSTGWTIGALVSLALWMLIVAGCQKAVGPDGVVLDPNAPPLIEPVIETGITLAQLLGAIWPPLIPIGTLAGGIFAAYKRLKPQIQEAQTAKDKYLAAGETLTGVLEDIKKNEPTVWAQIGPRIEKATSSSVVTALENTLREFRGLDAKPQLNQGV